MERAVERAHNRRMYHYMNDSAWSWMALMMVLWLIVIGAVVYAAVKLAQNR